MSTSVLFRHCPRRATPSPSSAAACPSVFPSLHSDTERNNDNSPKHLFADLCDTCATALNILTGMPSKNSQSIGRVEALTTLLTGLQQAAFGIDRALPRNVLVMEVIFVPHVLGAGEGEERVLNHLARHRFTEERFGAQSGLATTPSMDIDMPRLGLGSGVVSGPCPHPEWKVISPFTSVAKNAIAQALVQASQVFVGSGYIGSDFVGASHELVALASTKVDDKNVVVTRTSRREAEELHASEFKTAKVIEAEAILAHDVTLRTVTGALRTGVRSLRELPVDLGAFVTRQRNAEPPRPPVTEETPPPPSSRVHGSRPFSCDMFETSPENDKRWYAVGSYHPMMEIVDVTISNVTARRAAAQSCVSRPMQEASHEHATCSITLMWTRPTFPYTPADALSFVEWVSQWKPRTVCADGVSVVLQCDRVQRHRSLNKAIACLRDGKMS